MNNGKLDNNLPNNWKTVKLGEVCDKIGDGLHATPQYINDRLYYFINGNNLKNGKVIIDSNTKSVSFEEYKKYKKDLNNFTVLLSINGTIGSVAYYNNELVILGKSIAYINCNQNLLKNYLFYNLQFFETQKYFTDELTGTTIRNLSLKSIRETPIHLPPLPEQTRIAGCLSAWDKGIETLKKLIEAKKKLKKGLMQRLLSPENPLSGFEGVEWRSVRLKKVNN